MVKRNITLFALLLSIATSLLHANEDAPNEKDMHPAASASDGLCYIDALPLELFFEIVKAMDAQTRIQFAKTCRSYSSLINDSKNLLTVEELRFKEGAIHTMDTLIKDAPKRKSYMPIQEDEQNLKHPLTQYLKKFRYVKTLLMPPNTTPDAVWFLALYGPKQIYHLGLTDCTELDGCSISSALARLGQIKSLDISNANFSSTTISRVFAQLKSLEVLTARSSQLTSSHKNRTDGYLSYYIIPLTQIKEIDVSGTENMTFFSHLAINTIEALEQEIGIHPELRKLTFSPVTNDELSQELSRHGAEKLENLKANLKALFPKLESCSALNGNYASLLPNPVQVPLIEPEVPVSVDS